MGLFQQRDTVPPGLDFEIQADNTISLVSSGDSGAVALISTNTITDTTTWHHLLVGTDTTQATAANRFHIYLDGTEVSYGTATYPAQNYVTAVNIAALHTIGSLELSAGVQSTFFDGKMADIHFIDAQQLTPTSFTTGTGAGTIHPIRYTGGYGTNGFHLSFVAQDSSDSSGNGNNWTQNNSPTFSTDVPL